MEKRGRPFEPGNKFGRGRPRGSRNKRTLLVQDLLNGHSEALVRKALVLALQGDAGILRTLLGCVLPRCKDWPVSSGNLRTGTAADITASYDQVLQKVGKGVLTLREGQELATLLQGRFELQVFSDYDDRLRTIEQLLRSGQK